eukprot:TRINITY_DN3582_c0_g1_i2.p1 TRINITY_DN3582_c0_g1~~TRINITY_DN3582_c0_g1_i2.p1  ORF type:complete len:392 (+),score=112.31 TRINITY_DN3582_c0_g1_i2:83-1258(+)
MSAKTVGLIEAQRISAVLEEAVERLSVLQTITPDLLAHRDELAQTVGDEISRIIEDQRSLERRYEQLIAQRSQLKSLSNKSKYKENQAQIEEIARELRQSTKVLCRNLKENPNIAENLMKIQSERSSLQNLFSKTMRELKDLHYTALANSVDQEREDQRNLMETMQKEKEATAAVKSLQKELQEEKKEREREVSKSNEQIAKLKEDLHELRRKTASTSKYLRDEVQAQGRATQRHHKQIEDQLEEELNKLKKKVELETRVNNQIEEFLKRKQEKLQTKISTWNGNYEKDIEEKERNLENLRMVQANDSAKLKDTSKKYQDVSGQLAAERRMAMDRLEAIELDAKMHMAATKIQALWKGYRLRKQMADKKKKGKKSGSRGKSAGKKGRVVNG